MSMLRAICLMLMCASLWGEIIETAHFTELTQYVTPKTLVILDIDDTLLIPVQTLGTDVWFIHRLKHHLQADQGYDFALDRALAEWEAVRHMTDVKIVEEEAAYTIQGMQDKNISVMGLTTQGLALATRTVRQLHSLNIDLSKTAPSQEDHYFINGAHGVLYRQGILFTSGTAKGEALVKLLDRIDMHPEQVVFINDKKTHLEDLEKSLIAKGIPFTGLRYSYSDQRVNNFREDIAEIQWTYSTFNHLLSDEEAVLLLAQ